MVSQSEEMLKWAGDNWLKRNRPQLGKSDPVSEMIERNGGLQPQNFVCEIGCANGWRLKKLGDKYGCMVTGIDPSETAVAEARANGLRVERGVATDLPWRDASFNVVIMGFCLNMIDPSEWFAVVTETDRVLKDPGLLIIHDYARPRAYCKQAKFDEEMIKHGNIKVFFHDWTTLWTCHPAYHAVNEQFWERDWAMVSIMRKQMADCLNEISEIDE